MPVLVLGTYRDIELRPGLPFADAFESLIRQPAVDRLTLRRLPREAVAGVLGSLADREPPPRLVDVVYSETEGNRREAPLTTARARGAAAGRAALLRAVPA